MTYKLNDLTLAASSAIEAARDGEAEMQLVLVVTPTERLLVQEMAENAGEHEAVPLPSDKDLVIDTTGDAATVLLSSDQAQLESGWYVWDDVVDEWLGVANARMTIGLKKISGRDNATGLSNVNAEMQLNDF